MSRFVLNLVAVNLLVLLHFSCWAVAAEVPFGPCSALLIGNSNYDSIRLESVSPSLDLLENQLEQQGFLVQRAENLNQNEMKESLDQFVKSQPTAGFSLIYYQGLSAYAKRFDKHYNLLRPIKEKIENDGDYRSRGINLNELVKNIHEQGGAKHTLLVLDCLWQSPILPNKGEISGGLFEEELPDGVSILYNIEPKTVANLLEKRVPTPLARATAGKIAELQNSISNGCSSIEKQSQGFWSSTLSDLPGIGKQNVVISKKLSSDKHQAGDAFLNSLGMTFRWCPSGKFTMGSTKFDLSSTADRKPVAVTLSQGYWIGQYEVTQREYQAVMKKNLTTGFTLAKNAPVWGYADAKHVQDFCNKLTEMDRKSGHIPKEWEYAVPTEAQWEYACRAGSTDAYCFGNAIEQLGNYGNFADAALHKENPNFHWAFQKSNDHYGETLAPVGSYLPNAWGIHDMHGNLAEVVADHLKENLPGGTDPLSQVEKEGGTLIRGGAWCSLPLYCESSFRNRVDNREKLHFVGFRIVLKKAK